MITPERIAELKKLDAEASQSCDCDECRATGMRCKKCLGAFFAFVDAARTAVPELLAEVERLQDQWRVAQADLGILDSKLASAWEVMEFYADGKTWNYDSEVDKATINPWETRAGKDQGKKARAWLKENP